ncbi:MAG: hypothetical protein JWQ71_437 [Pedosphaera sp.]|nr:hypothetical protein [Pedosphaera sp.]
MALPEDIIAKVRRDFSEDEEAPILQMLSEYQQRHPEQPARILRCIVFLADGSFNEFAEAIKLAQLDWRDLIVSAEYDSGSGEERHVRNFNSPFVA